MQRPIQLLDGTGEIVPGLLCNLNDRHIEDFETIWKEILSATDQPDRDWNWDYKLRQVQQAARYEAYAIEVENLTQRVIWLETQWHRSQLPQRHPIVYIEALAAAPWNRRWLDDPPYLQGVGRTLTGIPKKLSGRAGVRGH